MELHRSDPVIDPAAAKPSELTPSAVVGRSFVQTNFLLGLKPVIHVRARLITSLDIEFIGSKLNSFFKGWRLDRRLDGMCWRGHRAPPAINSITDRCGSEAVFLAATLVE
jgi:hypothetical protein